MTQHLEYLPLQQTMPLMNPQYPPQYYENFTQLKKHIELKKFDKRANELAQLLIPYGQTNYNCWYVKKMCFLAGVVSFDHELEFSEETLYEKIKNFQLWEHRRFLLEHKKEFLLQQYELINKILDIESKNYHAWSHRIWILDLVQNFTEEIEFTHKMLLSDPYNNSVWAYRSNLVSNLIKNKTDPKEQEKIVYVELVECMIFLEKHLNNQAAWNYLRGYFPSLKLKSIPCTNSHTQKLVKCQAIEAHVMEFIKLKLDQLKKMFEQENYVPKHYHLEAQIQLLITFANLQSQNDETKQYSRNTCLVLAQKDKQKRFYWKWAAQNI